MYENTFVGRYTWSLFKHNVKTNYMLPFGELLQRKARRYRKLMEKKI